jgi:hypothetical protein
MTSGDLTEWNDIFLLESFRSSSKNHVQDSTNNFDLEAGLSVSHVVCPD